MHYDRALAKYVSLSMWQYYMIIMLWKRLWRVVSDRGELVDEYVRLSHSVTDDFAIPSDINFFLSGVGDVIDQDGRMNKLALNAQPSSTVAGGVYGFFGRLDARTHLQYETIPSPGVALLRVINDLRLTNDQPP